jgi:hypothetical protein
MKQVPVLLREYWVSFAFVVSENAEIQNLLLSEMGPHLF